MAANFEPHLKKSCDLVIDSVRKSCLNFSLQETPFSIYLSIRKSFARNKPIEEVGEKEPIATEFNKENDSALIEEIKMLKMKLGEAEDENMKLKHSFEEKCDSSEKKSKQIEILEVEVLHHEEDKMKLESELEIVEKNFRLLKKQVKEKDKIMHDLKKESETLARDLLQVETSFKTFKATVNQEKKREERKIKKRDSKDFLNNMKVESRL